MKKLLYVLILSLMILTMGCENQNTHNIEAPVEPIVETQIPLQAIIIIGNEFGNTYFDMKQALETQGFSVITVGIGNKELLSSCPNHETIEVTPDLDITEITEDNISEYALVFIPSGKHHRTIQYSKEVKRVLNLSKDNSLYISSVCAGNIVLSSVEGLIDGYEIACNVSTKESIDNAGGIGKYDRVVVDGCFVTGNTGGGKTGTGHEGAPTKELAEQLKVLIDEN